MGIFGSQQGGVGGGPTALGDLTNVLGTTPTDGQVLQYSTATGQWAPATPEGGSVEVSHTLSSTPGFGVTTSYTVADYTAMDAISAPSAGEWVEVTVGDTGDVELFVYSGSVYVGPFHAYVKNPKYTLGSNGEDNLVITDSLTNLISGFSPDISSRCPSLDTTEGLQVRRAAYVLPIFGVGSTGGRVTNNNTQADRWVGVIVNSANRGATNGYYSYLSSNQVAVLQGLYTSLNVVTFSGGVAVDATSYPGVGGIPARYSPTSGHYSSILINSRSSTTGVVEWDYEDYSSKYLTDVSNANPTDGQVLQYSTATSEWVPTTLASGGGKYSLVSSVTLSGTAGSLEAALSDLTKNYLIEISYEAGSNGDTNFYCSTDDGSTWTVGMIGQASCSRSSSPFNAEWGTDPVIGSNTHSRGCYSFRLQRNAAGLGIWAESTETDSAGTTWSRITSTGFAKSTSVNRLKICGYSKASRTGSFSIGSVIKVYEEV